MHELLMKIMRTGFATAIFMLLAIKLAYAAFETPDWGKRLMLTVFAIGVLAFVIGVFGSIWTV